MNLRVVLMMTLLSACGLPDALDGGPNLTDAGTVSDDAGTGVGVDAGTADAGTADAGTADAGTADAGNGMTDGGFSLTPAVPYSTLSSLCVMDIAVPAGPGPFPVVIFIHGGGWAPTGRAACGAEVKTWASRGYVAATIDYMGRAAGWREIVKSVKTAVKFLKAHAADYRLDVNRIGVVGSSAGGHLAAMLATTADDPSLTPVEFAAESDRVQVAVTLSASYDLVTNWNNTGDPGYVRPILETVFGGGQGQTPVVAPQGYADGSPLNHVSPDDARFCIDHGTADLTSPVEQVALMEAALVDAGVAVRTHVVEGAPHIWENTGFQQLWEADLASCLTDALE